MWVAGVDGCRGGWVAVLLEAHSVRRWDVRLCSTFKHVLALDPSPAVIAVDIPIGLPETVQPGGRDCDREARRCLGRRASSIFSPPARALLGASSYEEVRSYGVSWQAFGILPKIREVDEVMTPDLQRVVYEAHPELAFRRLRGAPMRWNKKTGQGRKERVQALARAPAALFGRFGMRLEELHRLFPRAHVASDDLLDACVLACTALRILRNEAMRMPVDPPVDRKGLRMEIWY